MDSKKLGTILLCLAAGTAIFTALAHMSCIVLGETCYRAQLAPEPIVQSAIDGTLLAPIGTTFVSALFVLCALYALSAANMIIQLPLVKLAIYVISALCLVRGLLTIPLSFAFPEMVSLFTITAGIIWFITGGLFIAGYRLCQIDTKQGQ